MAELSSDDYASGSYSARKEIESYAAKPWVHEIAEKVVSLIESVRPLSANDTVLDYGSGPGTTVYKLFEQMSKKDSDCKASTPSRKAFDALLIDCNELMIEKANQVKWKEKFGRTVKSYVATAFEPGSNDAKPSLTRKCSKILGLAEKPIDICILSLVLEYLTVAEVETLALELVSKLSDGGILALFEWAEHFAYPAEFESSIPHMRGWAKAKFLQVASTLCDEIERPNRVFEEERMDGKGIFASKPEYRVEASMGSFMCTQALTQDCPSGDTVNYLIIRKCKI